MSASSGKIQTVLGLIEPSEAGLTLPHEHLSLDFGCSQVKVPQCDKFHDLVTATVSQENLWWIAQHPYSNVNNLKYLEEHDAVIEEIKFFKSNGGGTIVENTTVGIKPDRKFYKEIAQKTGVNIVSGTGFYVEPSRKDTVDMTVEMMADAMMRDILSGCEETPDIKSGIIGEIGCNFPLGDSERKAVQAAGHVQKELGCPVIFHPGRNPHSPEEITRLYQEAGGEVDKLVMSHLDRTIPTIPELLEFAELGAYCEFDLFGIELSFYQMNESYDMPSDMERIRRIKGLLDAGFGDQVLISHDVHTKHRLMKYGGHGFSHILLNIIPRMLKRGITQEAIDKIVKENPQRWLTFK
ncbi:hypothetical protein ACJMK2_040467 [Sinanodonta woodiana]|uniref:Parathion hydrolase-related protein n=1 Tax=Sinanodonta woodiana TaxID=1069815 RepID=A0ABD3W4B1_SINWO